MEVSRSIVEQLLNIQFEQNGELVSVVWTENAKHKYGRSNFVKSHFCLAVPARFGIKCNMNKILGIVIHSGKTAG